MQLTTNRRISLDDLADLDLRANLNKQNKPVASEHTSLPKSEASLNQGCRGAIIKIIPKNLEGKNINLKEPNSLNVADAPQTLINMNSLNHRKNACSGKTQRELDECLATNKAKIEKMAKTLLSRPYGYSNTINEEPPKVQSTSSKYNTYSNHR